MPRSSTRSLPPSTPRGSRSPSTTPSSATASTSCRCCLVPRLPPLTPRSSSGRRFAPLPAGGLVASLAPKPWPDQAGNGAHIHLSVWDPARARNLFHDPAGRFGLSVLAEQFVAGILDHVAGLLALTAPSFNSFARLLPQHWSSAFTCWGPDNREATVRVPSPFWGEEAATTNLEYKPADASANPYLAFGGLIAAGLDGVERGSSRRRRSPSTPATSPTTSGTRRGSPATPRRSPRRSTPSRPTTCC